MKGVAMEAYVNGKKFTLDPKKAIGKGGEADIFDIGNQLVLKIYKQPNHPDFQGQVQEQQFAKLRLSEQQHKLPAFPRNLPQRIIAPQDLAYDKNGDHIIGYTMRFLQKAEVLRRYAEKSFRQTGINNQQVVAIFQDLHQTVLQLHQKKVVIGDFNDLNVMVIEPQAYLIDTDSFQFGPFFCKVFTDKFVDPLLCDPNQSSLMLIKPYHDVSDWYSFSVMLMQCLLFVDPYGGVYIPKEPKKRLNHTARPLKRITVFNPDVKYPKPATHYSVLPDDLLQYFHLVFEKDQRQIFPDKLLNDLHWQKCPNCGLEHARNVCPSCNLVTPAMIKEVVKLRGKVIATQVFKTRGVILYATYQNNNLVWLYHEQGQYKRENKEPVLIAELDPQQRYRLCANKTLIGSHNQIITYDANRVFDRLNVDSFGNLPIFDANADSRYWLSNGQLLRDGQLGPEYIGDVLNNQTLFWVGSQFGFGFYRAANLQIAFIFDAKRRGINDTIKLPKINGQLLDSTCCFTSEYCWFFYTTQVMGKTINHCVVIKKDGTIVATYEAAKGDQAWLDNIRGKCAAGNFLLTATDDGIVRVEIQNSQLAVAKIFSDTEPFVDSQSNLFPGANGLYVVGPKEIQLLKLG
jgi:H/ACA ribonucleoprotein complex subunit 3